MRRRAKRVREVKHGKERRKESLHIFKSWCLRKNTRFRRKTGLVKREKATE
jgi:hypothetical protein